jgi:hypothetical protein
VVALNLSDQAASLEAADDGKVLVGTDPDRAGERIDGGVVPLDPWEGVVFSLSLATGAGLRPPGSGASGIRS